MTVHLFGATSSPGCANLVLKTTADQYEESCSREATDFVRRNFYVDDGLKSVQFVEEAKELIKNTKSLCQKGGFRLHKVYFEQQRGYEFRSTRRSSDRHERLPPCQ